MAGKGRKHIITPAEDSEYRSLPPSGHARREVLKQRTARLQEVAERVSAESEIYSIDPEKLKEDPEILKHFDFQNQQFEVTHAQKGYAYLWERDDHRAIAFKKAQARFFLGPRMPGWEVVNSTVDPEAKELIQADNTRRIGDTILLRIKLDSYIEIHKKIALMNKFKEQNIPERLSEYVERYDNLVQVHPIVGMSPREYFARKGTQLQHTSSGPNLPLRTVTAPAGTITESSEE